MTCSADDMRAYRINARLSDLVIIIICISIYIYIYIFPVFCFPSCPETQFALNVQRQAPVVFLSVFRIKFACLPVVNIAFAARLYLPPPLPTNCSLARLPVAPCHEQSRFPILFCTITKLLLKIHRAHNAHTTAVVAQSLVLAMYAL